WGLFVNNYQKRFKVQKQKLMDKSLYFAALWSADYREHDQTEHTINYDHILSISLQDFIDWIHHCKIFISTTRYDEDELIRLLNLLDLSILFAADKLIEDSTDRIERHCIPPKYAIQMWRWTEDLNVKVLRDLSLDVCLDRFSELPLDSIYDLSKENFLKLIGNINIRATESYLVDVIREWNNRHKDFTVPLNIIENKVEKILQSFISCEDDGDNKRYIHCWDGNNFFELTAFEYPPDIRGSIKGMQITARRYDLYLCGGEYGIGSGTFNRNVWRYSLISKKWIHETVMPVERRHMITVFLKDKLYLVGGVGRYQQILKTIDIYDIYTGVWTSSGTRIPCAALFASLATSVPDHVDYNNQLLIPEYFPTYYNIYRSDVDKWQTESSDLFSPGIILTQHASCYIDVTDRHKIVLRGS
ncbi:uncharacterized protein LOC112458065, partial [Temnothorax curvispinosus]|uniref:Uncharacterized protein LOC112458065 n=1 Tax=Temnothorax curvispinosus TaxID=300111 RepID=A0A6J1Q8Q2_9HYME